MEIKVTPPRVPLRQSPDPGLPLEDPKAGHGCSWAASLLSCPAPAGSPALPGMGDVAFPCLSNTSNYDFGLQG